MKSVPDILLLDRNEQSAQEVLRFLRADKSAFTLNHASDIMDGRNYVKNRKPDLILLDSGIIEETEFAAFRKLISERNIPVVLLSDFGGEELNNNVEKTGAVEALIKNKTNLSHLQSTIENTLRVVEKEAKLAEKFNDAHSHSESFRQVLDKINSGVMVINEENNLCYSNEKALSILAEESIRKYLPEYFHYREVEKGGTIELNLKDKFIVNIRLSWMEWNNEPANLFVFDRFENKEVKAAKILTDEILVSLLDSFSENVFLLKGEIIAHANKHALKNLKLSKSEIESKPLNKYFEQQTVPGPVVSVESLHDEKEALGTIKLLDGATRDVKFYIKPINIGNEFYRLLSFAIAEEQSDRKIPKSVSDEKGFSAGGVLYLASHDLREPVRTILNYIQLTSENLQHKKYEEAAEFAGFAKTAADRMEKLLTDLKFYIGLNEHKFSLSRISMKSVLADVLKRMKTRIEDAQAEISFTELPEVNADKVLVGKLVEDLIDNAIKFHRNEKKPVIDIGYDKFEGNVIFCVRDNGIGISKKYYQKIFELFEKLNRVDEYPGNGLGLAIGKKIVEMHGGELWVESLPGSGSNFYFTLRGK